MTNFKNLKWQRHTVQHTKLDIMNDQLITEFFYINWTYKTVVGRKKHFSQLSLLQNNSLCEIEVSQYHNASFWMNKRTSIDASIIIEECHNYLKTRFNDSAPTKYTKPETQFQSWYTILDDCILQDVVRLHMKWKMVKSSDGFTVLVIKYGRLLMTQNSK